MSEPHSFFVTAPLGLELLLADELRALGAGDARERKAGVAFTGSLEAAYRACLWSRLGNRVLLKLAEFPASTPEDLYAGIHDIDWAVYMVPDATLAVDFASQRSAIRHTQYGAQKVKDAIVDQFRELCGVRPSVRLDSPDIRVNVYLEKDVASVSLDLSGESLHKRGYRLEGGAAPLKENLAAAILLRAGWPAIARSGGELLDPMCGSGTLLIEAAWIAADIAPGLQREHFGFLNWKGHDSDLWGSLLAEARARRDAGLALPCNIGGHDLDRHAIHAALGNIERAGLRGRVYVERKPLSEARPRLSTGLLAVNPPYGERLGDQQTLIPLYTELGEILKSRFSGWHASVFTGNPELAFRLGIRATKFYRLFNGALECRLFNFEVEPERYFTPHEDESGLSEEARQLKQLTRRAQTMAQRGLIGPGGEMFGNRLRKNLKTLGRWARQNGVSCYRLYDADLPEYAVAVDVYQGDKTWVTIQEYEAPTSVAADKAESRLVEVLAVVPATLEIPPEQVYLKVRRKQKGTAQYEKQAGLGRFHRVEEGGCAFWVNFEDYLDTGLFLDHRPTRLMVGKMAHGKRFLNLFAYTGAATVHAAVGGAGASTTVDMSNTYLEWAKRNLELNGVSGKQHELIQADCLGWLEAEAAKRTRRYDLIFLDPPTFSNSKRMSGAFDVQRDHVALIEQAASLLAPGGVLIFSTNFRKFKLDRTALSGLSVEDVSRQTIPKDFERNPRIHQCYMIRGRDEAQS
ncbi:bifunctional 23S rRNA (guanine(2069)-N(7))-methyltransferase RlmK/23S rRNA (guanine(2445)-N(2))-methyltransferase RlmL [Methylococcus sp. EFPC2]|uniref:bifunctional 23S rRNA (guanine(2069)-N(7))-methyltransferase RlmK/23S rRNA (guanine(2445)-N(2))-methyltransferase RlmL n=1 Tax=Methylococcus sp. EFPC2 TaxID=2812648 RepID=UPI00196776EF|nr:bifunctional 23S rRNA (guanine(2069)-N(7))-methyltransferase RlmK/23S rRNA (guanine(2445)-N(2))-methyltransferase RlmL [Methylococcus sp. EFPC2]QSA98307.1 bifunctional 23S rRNA (guanine(2069)-N(7))-methyltransferase RlmK/23S rRNA (guanine(2445)-N(2))-methyltransferase RlmL [Methylococcus sp. EFPC2]